VSDASVRDRQHRFMSNPFLLFPFLFSPFVYFRRLRASLNHVSCFRSNVSHVFLPPDLPRSASVGSDSYSCFHGLEFSLLYSMYFSLPCTVVLISILFPLFDFISPFKFGSPWSSFAPPCQAGPASGSDTTRKPLAPRSSLIPPFRVPPGQKHYTGVAPLHKRLLYEKC
jgi:hypothetical protein